MSEEERQAIIHLLDKQARYEYCINNSISFSDEDYEAYIIRQSMINKDKEIERLNNIINELEKARKDYRVSQLKLINDFKRRYELISSDPPTRHLLRCLLENLTLYSCKIAVLEELKGSDK